MRLCHIVPSLAEEHGGPSKSVRAVCGALADAQHDVDLLATDPSAPPGGESRVEGTLRITIYRRDWPQRICRSSGLKAALRTTDAGIVHHHSLWLRTLHYAERRAARGDTKLVISPRGMMSAWAWRYRGRRKQFAGRFIHPGALAAAAGWHATSDEEEKEIRALGFTQPVCVAPNGVDAPTEEAKVRAVKHWRATLGTGDRPVALFYSRFHRKKRVLELIDLWLAHAPAHWLLLLVGIPQEYTPATLEHYATKMSAGNRVRVFSGASLPPPYGVASLFLLPSHNENFGLVIAEAMAHGVPVLVTDTTPWNAINRDGLGWCVPWEDYGAVLTRATQESPPQLAQRGAAARAWVLREFSWRSAASKLGAFYAELKAGST